MSYALDHDDWKTLRRVGDQTSLDACHFQTSRRQTYASHDLGHQGPTSVSQVFFMLRLQDSAQLSVLKPLRLLLYDVSSPWLDLPVFWSKPTEPGQPWLSST